MSRYGRISCGRISEQHIGLGIICYGLLQFQALLLRFVYYGAQPEAAILWRKPVERPKLVPQMHIQTRSKPVHANLAENAAIFDVQFERNIRLFGLQGLARKNYHGSIDAIQNEYRGALGRP